MRALPTGLTAAALGARGGPQRAVHLVELERADGVQHFWASEEINALSTLTGAAAQFKPWLLHPLPSFTFHKSVAADTGEISVQNLTGNTIDREVAALVRAKEFERAYVIYRRHYLPAAVDAWSFPGLIQNLVEVSAERVTFRVQQLFQPNELPFFEGIFTRPCRFLFGEGRCGHRRGHLFVPLTTADTFSASTIGKTGLGLTPDLYKHEVVMTIGGTGAGQERFIASHTADVFTLKANWTTAPDGTTTFLVTGPGTLLVPMTLADIHTASTIGKTASGWAVDAFKDQLAVLMAGTGATGSFEARARRITGNTADTLTVSPAWAVAPDATTRFIVVHRDCERTRAACSARGVLERFSGIIHANALIQQVASGARGNATGAGVGRERGPVRAPDGRIRL